MKFCAHHWRALQLSIKDKGLWHLVAKSEGELRIRVVNALYEPLLNAQLMINDRAIREVGDYLRRPKVDLTQYCPLCELNVETKDKDTLEAVVARNTNVTPADVWIDQVTDECVKYCIEHKMLPKAEEKTDEQEHTHTPA